MPRPAASVFSAIRCCAACRAATPGLARQMPLMTSMVAAGTFSNSLVTASTLAAKWRRLSMSSYRAVVVVVATEPAGLSAASGA